MKKGTLRLAAGWVAAGVLAASSAGAEEKVGVLNVQYALKQYYKAQAATESLRKLDDELRDAHRRMVNKLGELEDEAEKAVAEANDKALSEEARARKRAAAEDKVAERKEYEIQVRKSEIDYRKKMEEQNALMGKSIMQEVRQAASETAREQGLTLVIDGSETPMAPVIFFDTRLDITDVVLKRLNKNIPAPAKAEGEKPAEPKPAEPKPAAP